MIPLNLTVAHLFAVTIVIDWTKLSQWYTEHVGAGVYILVDHLIRPGVYEIQSQMYLLRGLQLRLELSFWDRFISTKEFA